MLIGSIINLKMSKEIEIDDVVSMDNTSHWGNKKSIIPSSYYKTGMKQAYVNLMTQSPDDHILCIGYNEGDVQFGLSESFKKGEKRMDALKRALIEEINYEFKDKLLPNFYKYTYRTNEYTSNNHIIFVNITSDTKSFKRYPISIDTNNVNDDKTNKLIVIIHGDKEVLKEKFKLFSSSESKIASLNLIPVGQLNLLFKFLN